MKLFASIENEKGKLRSMGGNEYLDIDIAIGNNALCSLTLRHTDELPEVEGSGWCIYDQNDQPLFWIEDDNTAQAKGPR